MGKSLMRTVFPTRVGMNRAKTASDRRRSGVPHARGDEPPMPMNS